MGKDGSIDSRVLSYECFKRLGPKQTGTIFVVNGGLMMRLPRREEERGKRKVSVIGHDAKRCRSNEWGGEEEKVVAY